MLNARGGLREVFVLPDMSSMLSARCRCLIKVQDMKLVPAHANRSKPEVCKQRVVV